MNDYSNKKYSTPIKQLDRNLINKIAAGEVIERPASVIKETVENSFDAGATSVEIIAEKAGTTYISIKDNGCGIHSDQIDLAFSRHATSKIKSIDDLFAVNSFGFRGEALPSIASISHLTLTSRHYSEPQGTFVVFEGGREIEKKPIATPIGTKVEIGHLFYNTPARRKFLKAELTESRHIIRVVERMALGKPSASIALKLNNRQVIDVPANQPSGQRMAALFGVKPDSIVEYDVELGEVSFLVYLAHPEQARHDRTRICLFINGRSVTSSSIIHAVTSGYGEFLPAGKYPLATIYLTIDPSQLDVNVHPTKAEVRLSNERAIHDNLYRIVKRALRDWRLVPAESKIGQFNQTRSTPSTRNIPSSDIPHQSRSLFGPKPTLPNPSSFSYAPKTNSLSKLETIPCDNTKPVSEEITGQPKADTITQSEAIAKDDVNYMGKVGRQYLLINIRGELYIIDQHAAHERVLYEDAIAQVEKGSCASQKLLFPETIELSGEEFLVVEESNDVLNKTGFEIEPFGGNSVIVRAMPPVFKDKNPALILKKLLDDIAQLNKAGGEMMKSIAQSLACRAAVMAGDKLSQDEVSTLIQKLFSMNNPYCCPHGRPTFIKIGIEELDSRFGRS